MKLRNGKNTKSPMPTSAPARVFNTCKRGYSNIIPCKNKRWYTCPRLLISNKVTSTVNGRTFSLSFGSDISWKSNHLIYLITWTAPNCGIQYVGQTGQYFHKRVQQHLYRFRRHKKFKTLIYQHLEKHQHNINFIKVQPLEIVHRLKDQSHKQHERSRLDCELKWIKKLQTVYPLGLNDNVMGVGNVSRLTNFNIMEISSKKSRNNRSHGRRINRNKRKFHRVFVTLSDLLNIFKNNGRHKLLCKLSTIPAQRLHNVYTDCLSISHTSPKYELSLIISAFALNKLFPRPNKPENVKRYF